MHLKKLVTSLFMFALFTLAIASNVAAVTSAEYHQQFKTELANQHLSFNELKQVLLEKKIAIEITQHGFFGRSHEFTRQELKTLILNELRSMKSERIPSPTSKRESLSKLFGNVKVTFEHTNPSIDPLQKIETILIGWVNLHCFKLRLFKLVQSGLLSREKQKTLIQQSSEQSISSFLCGFEFLNKYPHEIRPEAIINECLNECYFNTWINYLFGKNVITQGEKKRLICMSNPCWINSFITACLKVELECQGSLSCFRNIIDLNLHKCPVFFLQHPQQQDLIKTQPEEQEITSIFKVAVRPIPTRSFAPIQDPRFNKIATNS